MSYTEVENVGWFSRIKNSVGGAIFGLLLFLLSFPVLWWNEGNAVRQATGIAAARKAVVEASPERIDPAHEGKLVHVTGRTSVGEPIKDEATGFTQSALRVRRSSQIYQWEQTEKTETRKKLGGGEERVKTYDYRQVWTDQPIDSSAFKQKKGHVNTGSLPFENSTLDNPSAKLGAFRMGPALAKLSNFQKAPLSAGIKLPVGFQVEGDTLYRGNPEEPKVGDARIMFEVVPTGEVSVMAAQVGDTFAPYKAAETEVLIANAGAVSSTEMLKHWEQAAGMLTWVLRLVGFAMMAIGVASLMGPIAVVADFIPFLGSLVGFGAGLIGFGVALPLTLFTIAAAWVAHRPLLAVGLIVVGIAGVVGLARMKKS